MSQLNTREELLLDTLLNLRWNSAMRRHLTADNLEATLNAGEGFARDTRRIREVTDELVRLGIDRHPKVVAQLRQLDEQIAGLRASF